MISIYQTSDQLKNPVSPFKIILRPPSYHYWTIRRPFPNHLQTTKNYLVSLPSKNFKKIPFTTIRSDNRKNTFKKTNYIIG